MKKYLLLFSLMTLVSCKWFNQDDEKPVIDDVAKEVVLGGDKDKNGCLASAGYTWSKLNEECIRVFSGLQLSPIENLEVDDATLCAYVLFDEKATKAELFLPNINESLILNRSSKEKSWSNDDYVLISSKGFVLKKEGKILFSGDGEGGNKVSGSDDNEEIQITE
ncbi:hypothetical protein [Flavobacterium sp.]|uniref:hypothetical protein n=1 Tax=Flavobacterium sp. TaxID=239 RepID=UPI003751EA18